MKEQSKMEIGKNLCHVDLSLVVHAICLMTLLSLSLGVVLAAAGNVEGPYDA